MRRSVRWVLVALATLATSVVPLAASAGPAGADAPNLTSGFGITVSYWADAASATAWRDHPDHVRIRNAGRDRWYESYEVVVTQVTRDYCWRKG